MALKTLPPRALLRELLHYDVTTGQFTWLPSPALCSVTSRTSSYGTPAMPGKSQEAGADRLTYWYIAVHHIQYFAHRLVWLYVHGDPVPDCIDHIDGNPLNNRFSNLRASTKAQNCANMRLRDANTSGVKGVGPYKGRWRARIMVNFKDHHLGTSIRWRRLQRRALTQPSVSTAPLRSTDSLLRLSGRRQRIANLKRGIDGRVPPADARNTHDDPVRPRTAASYLAAPPVAGYYPASGDCLASAHHQDAPRQHQAAIARIDSAD